MTLLASWIGVDNKKNGPKPCSLYIVSDSRISWRNGNKYDNYRKVFGMKNHPDVFGFCGDVLFSQSVLSNIVHLGDTGFLFPSDSQGIEKFQIIKAFIIKAFNSYPQSQIVDSFKIIHGSRDSNSDFHCFVLSWDKKDGFQSEPKILPSHSAILTVEGSGAKEFIYNYDYVYNHSKNNNSRTSRTVYHCFADTLEQIEDKGCGGVPQVVGLYRRENARFFGIIKDGKRFLAGEEVIMTENLNFVEWRNDLFERCDPHEMKIIASAQRQPKS